MDGGGDDRASEEEDCPDGGETSNSHEGVQGSHDGDSRVLRGTLCGQKRPPRFPRSGCLDLSCGQAERWLNLGLSVAVRRTGIARLLATAPINCPKTRGVNSPRRF